MDDQPPTVDHDDVVDSRRDFGEQVAGHQYGASLALCVAEFILRHVIRRRTTSSDSRFSPWNTELQPVRPVVHPCRRPSSNERPYASTASVMKKIFARRA